MAPSNVEDHIYAKVPLSNKRRIKVIVKQFGEAATF